MAESEAAERTATSACLLPALLVAFNLVVIAGIFAVPKFVISETSDSNYYTAIAHNIGHSFRFTNPHPARTWPIGWPLLMSPAMASADHACRFALAYGTQLLGVNFLLVAVYRLLRRFHGSASSAMLATIVIASTGITGFFWSLYAELSFTIFLCLAFIAVVHAASSGSGEDERLRWWALAGFLSGYACTIRAIGAGALFGLALTLLADAHLRRRIPIKATAITSIAACAGFFPLALQKISVHLEPAGYFTPQYPDLASKYAEYFLTSVSSPSAFTSIFLKAAWHELALLFHFTLGGIVIFAVYGLPLSRKLWERRREARAEILPYLFAFAFVGAQLAQATVHVIGYILRTPNLDRISRYLMPASTLTLLALFVLVAQLPLGKVLAGKRRPVAALVATFFALLVFALPFSRAPNRLFNYTVLAPLFESTGFMIGSTLVFCLLFAIVWFRRELAIKTLLVCVLGLFVVPRILEVQSRVDRGEDYSKRFQVTARKAGMDGENTERVFFLYPSDGASGRAKLVYRLNFMKGDGFYYGLTLDQFAELEDDLKSSAFVFATGGVTIPECETRVDGEGKIARVSIFDCREPNGVPRPTPVR